MTPKKTVRPRPERSGIEPVPAATRLATVIASVPGVAEQSLRATLESLASIEIVGTAAGCLTAMQLVRDRQADLVVIDSNLPFEEVRVFLQHLKQARLATRALVLASTSSQVRQALDAGADAALRREASIGQLSSAVDRLNRTHPEDLQEASSATLSLR